ncbi:NPCBM/NEW2 domain-containing protein [Intrasporangium sp. DVR]|uniref:NPCBM/NEW2 domain-containing protein n=1 Tax=Intrasporangium sp. DVR TaxID=3127867 RepID=UPI00333E3167
MRTKRRFTPALIALSALAATVVASVGTGAPAQAADPAPPTADTFASDLPWVSATNGLGPVERDRSNGGSAAGDGRSMYIEHKYSKGLGVNADSVVRYHLGGSCETFISDVGIDAEVGSSGSVTFTVIADGVSVAQTGILTGTSPVGRIMADIDGATYVDLVVSSAGDGSSNDHADWGGAKFECSGDGVAAARAPHPAPTATTSASDLPWVSATNGWGPVEKDRSNGEQLAGDGRALKLGSTTYAKGLGVHSESRIRYFLGMACNSFTAKVGVDEEVGWLGSVSFHVYVDGVQVVESPRLTGLSATYSLVAPVRGAGYVDLVVDDQGDGIDKDHADWADATFLCGNDAAGEAFYTAPATLGPDNGDIVRSEASSFYVDPLKITKVDAAVTRMMYRSTDRLGQPIGVTGQLIVPSRPWSGTGPRPLVAWAPGTQGLGDQCAPSKLMASGQEYEGAFIAGLIARGYVVAVTDYQGLGTPGIHSYMIREAQAHALLDAARAAFELPGTGLTADSPVALTGYSQGGGATAAAVELAPAYAPELKVVGAAAGGVPGDLALLAEKLDGTFYVGFLGYAIRSITDTYGISLADLANERGQALFRELEDECTVESMFEHAFTQSSSLTLDGRPITAYLNEPWIGPHVEEQRIGNGRKPTVPVLVIHSLTDDVVPYEAGRGTAARWCAEGAQVRFQPSLGPGHVGGFLTSYGWTLAFLEDTFAGKPMQSNCGTF